MINTRDHIGKKGVIRYSVTDGKSGLRNITISGTQGSVTKVLHSVTFPRSSYIGKIGPAETSETVTFDTKKEGFVDGPMSIKFEASDYSLRGWLQGNKTIINKEVTVDTVPPQLQILQSEKYISPGGTGVAIYRLSDNTCTSGVTINGHFHPGFLVGDGRKDIYICLFCTAVRCSENRQLDDLCRRFSRKRDQALHLPLFSKELRKRLTPLP